MSAKNLIVRGGADFSSIKKELDKTQKHLTSFQKSISKTLKGIGAVLGGLAIGKFIKESINATSELESAFQGLESILEGQGRSVSKAKDFINDYIEDGLIPLTNAVTAYKNLAARGYNDEQIQITMNRLKDAASFGRQASYSLGDAVSTATEGLKNENSVLVDNAGVTKNVAKMWDDYAKSIGKNRNQLTQHEKIQAEVNGIMQETQFQVGDAAKYADNYAGRLAGLNKTLRDIQVNIGNAFMPIANVVLPLLQKLANAIARVTAFIAQFMQVLFGKVSVPKAQVDTTQGQATAVEELGDATEKAGKQAKKASRDLAGFDEINQLSLADSGTGAGAGAGGGAAGGELLPDIETSPLIQSMENVTGKAREMAEKVRAAFSVLKDAVIENKNIIIPALGAIAGALAGIALYAGLTGLISVFKILGNVVKDVWKILMGNPIMRVFALIGALIGALVTAYMTNDKFRETVDRLWEQIKTALTPVIQALGEVLIWLWESVIVPLGAIVLDVLVVAFNILTSNLKWLWEYVLVPLGKFIIESLVPIFLEIAKVAGTVFALAIEGLIKVFEFLWYSVLKPIASWLVNEFKPTFEIVGEWIKAVIQGLQTIFDGLIKFIAGVFTNNWRLAWEGVRQIFKGVFDSLYGIVKVPLDLILKAINDIIDAVNSLISKLNKVKITVPSGVPGIGGKSFGINVPSVPKLATGGITNGPMLAMVGDNPGGREVVSPLDDLMDMIASAVGSAMVAAGNFTGGDTRQGDLILQIDGTTLARVMNPFNTKETNRIGPSMIVTR